MGQPCYFCTSSTYWTAVKDCVGYSRHMVFPSICRPRAEPVAKQVDSNNPPPPPSTAHQVACTTPSQPWLGNDSSTRKTSRSFPSHSHRAGTPIPSCQSKQQHAKMLYTFRKASDFLTTYCHAPSFERRPHSLCPPLKKKKGTWAAALEIVP